MPACASTGDPKGSTGGSVQDPPKRVEQVQFAVTKVEGEGLTPIAKTLPESFAIDAASGFEPGSRLRPPFAFGKDDEALLDEIQRACFYYFWVSANPETGMIPDRSTITTVSVAGVGFQLSAILVGVERGWITRQQGEERVRLIVSSLKNHPENRKYGIFYHFVDGKTGGQPEQAYEYVASTIDTALLFGGLATVSTYFGGDIATMSDALMAEANWRAVILGERGRSVIEGPYISLAWKPKDKNQPTGEGTLMPYGWQDVGGEGQLVTFFAVGSPVAEHQMDPKGYYKMRRNLGMHAGIGGEGSDQDMLVHLPYSGAAFIHFFQHCWIDFAGMGTDDPAKFGVANRPAVDWWENSRRFTTFMQKIAPENPKVPEAWKGLSWGLTAGDWKEGYQVPGVYPQAVYPTNWVPNVDFANFAPKHNWGDGTLAPYGPGSSIMFDPKGAMEVLRAMRQAKRPDGTSLCWWPQSEGGYGLTSFNPQTLWRAHEYVAIDHGPMILAIENARTGLIWKYFHQHAKVKMAMERLGWSRVGGRP